MKNSNKTSLNSERETYITIIKPCVSSEKDMFDYCHNFAHAFMLARNH